MSLPPFLSSNPACQYDENVLLDAFYCAYDYDTLLVAIGQYLTSINLKAQFSIAYKIENKTDLTVKHCYNSEYQENHKFSLFSKNNGQFWAIDNNSSTKRSRVEEIKRRRAVPFYTDNELTGCLILEDNASISQESLVTLSINLGRNITRLALSQLYMQQHQHDQRKLSSIERMKTVMRELDLDKVLTGFIDLMLSTVSGSAACSILVSTAMSQHKKITEIGVTQEELDSLVHLDYGPITHYVMAQQQAWLTADHAEFTDFTRSRLLDRLNSFLILPITIRDGSGCVFIADPENINENSLEIAQTIIQLSRISIDNALLHAEVVDRAIHKQQLEIAGGVQNSLLPKVAPDISGISIFGLNIPCDDSSGDYYDFIKLQDGSLCFVLGDATGHGIGAAILATTARAMLRALLQNQKTNPDLVAVCTTLNNLLDSDLAADKFITLFIGIVNPFNRTLVYASAGHDPPLIMYHPEKDCFTELQSTGLPLGVLPDMDYDVSQPILLENETKLILMSDGIPEAINTNQQMYGKGRVQDFIRKKAHHPADEFCHEIVTDVASFRGIAPQTDDITIVTLTVH